MEKKERKTWMVQFISTIFILGIFALASLFLTNIGVKVYKNIVITNNNNFELRTSLSYIATKIRQADTMGEVYLTKKDGTDVLVIGEWIDGNKYETLIYYYNGFLCEHYREAETEYTLDYGMEMIQIADFSMKQDEGGMFIFTASNQAGETEELKLFPRSAQRKV